ncbi:3-phosphoserine/phosphohydroxythreonine transaminase [Zymobacter sp. IVIA_12111.31 C1]|uniref:3-phosphoserine/phosphohydroxythreonine transaminase n=1 Tax=Zymobacter sp. IVIA_12111.31 C1 TaxID=3394854 RepID=UPI0039C23B64
MRHYNFSPGPATLPEAVLEQAQEELLDFHGLGASVMEISHRGPDFMALAEQAEADLRELMGIPDNYRVLFLSGGASTQFASAPLNLAAQGRPNIIDSGIWSSKAIDEAKRLTGVHVAASTKDSNYSRAPLQDELVISDDAAYLHYTDNETIGGVQFDYIPQAIIGGQDVPVICDMSSSIMGREMDVSKFGMIYAGAQKNIGPAGITLVIVRDDLLAREPKAGIPTMLDYRTMVKTDSMYNTPPTFAWYLCGLVFQWMKRQGGIPAIAEINQRKASKLYAAIDNSDFYSNPVELRHRSITNVPFILADESLNARFLAESKAAGLLNLKGHRSVGGMRASLYNAMPEAGVDALVDFMKAFERDHG